MVAVAYCTSQAYLNRNVYKKQANLFVEVWMGWVCDGPRQAQGLGCLRRSARRDGRAGRAEPRHSYTKAILLGAIDTPMLRENPDVKSGVEHIDPSEVGKPADIAAAAAFPSSDAAAFVQGTGLIVDGGRIIAL